MTCSVVPWLLWKTTASVFPIPETGGIILMVDKHAPTSESGFFAMVGCPGVSPFAVFR